jgi:tetratricopeptide (TPR) repeat protein
MALTEVGKRQEAIAVYQTALKKHPGSVDVVYNLGLVLQKHAQLSEAIECYRQALELSPSHVPSLCNLGLALEERSRRGLAAQRRRFLLGPQVPQWLMSRAGATAPPPEPETADFTVKEALTEAIDCYSRARRLCPDR